MVTTKPIHRAATANGRQLKIETNLYDPAVHVKTQSHVFHVIVVTFVELFKI